MREIVSRTTVYTWDELSESAQKNAVTEIQQKLGDDWWDSTDNDGIAEVIRYSLADAFRTPGYDTYGVADFPGIPDVTLDGWDLDRAQSISLSGILTRNNAPALPWIPEIGKIELDAKHTKHTDITLTDAELECTCSSSSWWHDPGCPADTAVPEVEDTAGRSALKQAVRDALSAAWHAGYAELEYKTGTMRARIWIHDNELEFTEDGSLWTG